MAEGKSDAEVKLILYHWTHSFSSQKVKASAGRAARIGFQHLDTGEESGRSSLNGQKC